MSFRNATVVRVFVSSTWHDLQAERRAVQSALARLTETQFLGMEYFGSEEKTPRAVSLARLEQCQLYVGIIGGRYGSGITADEYRHAGELGIPRFIYRMAEPPGHETDPDQQARLEQFVGEIGNLSSVFTTPDDLAARVTSDLHRWLVDEVYKPQIRDAGFAAELADAYLSPEPVYERLDLARFAGRGWLLKNVDDFLAGCDRGYFILEADAGMGKTAVLAHLVKTHRWIHHFVELARGEDGIRHGLRNLAAQIVFRWKPELEGSLANVQRPDYLERLLFAAAARRDEVQPGEKIVLVVDALDESAAMPGQNVMGLPRVLPAGVYVIVSRRPVHVVLDIDTPRWPPVRLESAAPANVSDMREFLENVAAGERVAALLEESAVAPDDFVSTLLDRSQGVWIYLHYIVEELERGERRPLDLEALPRGLWPYYARYWRSRREHDAWSTLELPLLATLAAAQEDLSPSILSAFAGVEESQRVHRLLEEWRPFLAASTAGGERRFRCYHASFREFLEGRVDRALLTESEARFADELAAATRAAHVRIADLALNEWGGLANGLEGLQDPTRRDVYGGYALRHVVGHLLSADRLRDVSALLQATRTEQNVWYAVHEKIRDLQGYLSDVRRTWLAAETASALAIAQNQPAASVMLEARCALLFSSVGRLAELVRPRLIAALVAKRVWEPRHALTYASEIGNGNLRFGAMARLTPLLSGTLREKAFGEAVAAARWTTREAFAELPGDLPHDLLQAILREELGHDSKDKALKLAAFAPNLPADLLSVVVSFAETVEEVDFTPTLVLVLLPLVQGAERERLIAKTREIANETSHQPSRLQILQQLAPFLLPDEKDRIARECLRHASDPERFKAALVLVRTIPLLEGEEREQAARAALELVSSIRWFFSVREEVRELILQLSPKLLRAAEKRFFFGKSADWKESLPSFLPRWAGHEGRLVTALSRIEKHRSKCDKELAALAPFLPGSLVERALNQALARSPSPLALDALAPRLTATQLEHAVASLFSSSVSCEPSGHSEGILEKAQRSSRGVDGGRWIDEDSLPPDTSADDLVRGAAKSSPAERSAILAKALRVTDRIRSPRARVETLLAIAYLSGGARREQLFARAVALIRAGAFEGWSESVPGDLVVRIAPNLSEPLLRDVLDWARTLNRHNYLSRVLRAVVPRLPEGAGAEVLVIEPDAWFSLAPSSSQWSMHEAPAWINRLWTLLPKSIGEKRSPQQTISGLVALLPRRPRARLLTRLAVTSGAWIFREALRAVRAIRLPEERVRLLTAMLPRLVRRDFGETAAHALIAALAIQEPAQRAAALGLISQCVPALEGPLRGGNDADHEDALLERFAATGNAHAVMRRLQRSPDESRPALVEKAKAKVLATGSSPLQTWAFVQLAPYMTERDAQELLPWRLAEPTHSGALPHLIERWGTYRSPLPEHVVQLILPHLDYTGEVLIALAPHLPDSLLEEALSKAWTSGKRDDVLAALAERMTTLPGPELHELWRKAMNFVAATPHGARAAGALLPIADRLGAQYDF